MTMLTTSDGVGLAARSWSASGEPRASVVLVHGLAATKDNPELVAVAAAYTAVKVIRGGPHEP